MVFLMSIRRNRSNAACVACLVSHPGDCGGRPGAQRGGDAQGDRGRLHVRPLHSHGGRWRRPMGTVFVMYKYSVSTMYDGRLLLYVLYCTCKLTYFTHSYCTRTYNGTIHYFTSWKVQ